MDITPQHASLTIPEMTAKRKDELCIYRHIDSFVNEEDFENKQFDRYVTKTKELLLKHLPTLMPSGIQIGSVELAFEVIIATYYTQFDPSQEINAAGTCFKLIHKHIIKPEKLQLDCSAVSEVTDEFIDNMNIKMATYGLADLVNFELRAACKEFVRRKAAVDDKINRSNYFSALPKTASDAMEIVKDVLNWTAIDVERLYNRKSHDVISNMYKDKFSANMSMKLTIANNEIERKDAEIQELNSKIADLSAKLKASEQKCPSCKSETTMHINALKRENKKLMSLYEALLQKYQSIIVDDVTQNEMICNTDELKIPELDVAKRYLFVIGEQACFQQQIKDAFPNSRFTTKVQSISQMDTDCVIVITSHIGHSVYLGMKNQCKSKNISFVHCEHSNVELIKQLLINALY